MNFGYENINDSGTFIAFQASRLSTYHPASLATLERESSASFAEKKLSVGACGPIYKGKEVIHSPLAHPVYEKRRSGVIDNFHPTKKDLFVQESIFFS